MKKFIILFLMLMILTSCSFKEYASEIEIVNLSNGETTTISGDSDLSDIILKAIKTKDKNETEFVEAFTYGVNIKRDSQTQHYDFKFDIPAKAVYVVQDNKNYKVNDGVARQLLLNEVFSCAYIDSTIYNCYINYNEQILFPETAYDWTYKNTEGFYTKKEGSIKEKTNNKSIVYTGNESLNTAYEKQPDSQVIKIYSNGKQVSAGKNLMSMLDLIESDGLYDIECELQWFLKDNAQGYGKQNLKFSINVDKPANASVITRDNYPGNILLLQINNLNSDENATVKTDAVKVPVDMFNYNDKGILLCPIDLYAVPGTYDLNIIVNEGLVTEYTIVKDCEIKSKAFKTQYLTVSEELNDTNNDDAAIYEYAQLVKPARTKSLPEKLWQGTFDMPVDGRLTTDFAEIRFVNNEQSSSRHSGLDLAAPSGTEVKAPNSGRVVFAMEGLLSTGNTIVLDHGMGLFTSYYHLNSINIKNGDDVQKGEVIGTVGTTGFSTGPHLHYAVSIYNTYVNPYQTLSGIID